MKKTVLIGVCAIVTAPAVFAAMPNMKEGNWELVTTITSREMPFPIPPMKITHCYTQDEIEKRKNPAAGDADRKDECQVMNQKANGKKTTWSVTCKGGSRGTGQAFYDGNRFDSTTTYTDRSGSVTTTSIKGRRLGDCR